MKIVKLLIILALVYVVIVVSFESLIGYFQPAGESTLVITTVDHDGDVSDRVLSTLEYDGKLYVAANHWPRAWFREARANPQVEVTRDGERGEYEAVLVTGDEHDAIEAAHPLGPVVLFLTGFPPRYFVRLDPR